jgi:hypothetical protein
MAPGAFVGFEVAEHPSAGVMPATPKEARVVRVNASLILVLWHLSLSGCAGVLDEVKQKADNSGKTAIAHAEASGSTLVAQTAVALDLIRANIMSDVARERLSLEAAAQRLITKLQSKVDCALTTASATTVDFKVLAADLAPWAADRPFFIQQISNAVIGYPGNNRDTGTFELLVVGNGIGSQGESASTRVAWSVGGVPLRKDSVNSVGAHQVTLRIPRGQLLKVFADDRTVFVPVDVTADIVEHRLIRRDRQRRYSTRFSIALLPRTAAVITELNSTTVVPSRTEPRFASQETGVAGADTLQMVTQPMVLPVGAELTTNPFSYDCVGTSEHACGHCFSVHGKEYETDCLVTQDGAGAKLVTCHRKCDPKTIAKVSHRVSYTMPSTTSVNNTITLTDDGRIKFDIPYQVKIPANNYTIKGRTISGNDFVLLSAAQNSEKNDIYSRVEPLGNEFRVVVEVNGPAPYKPCP